jgi:hypothetical protein
MPEIGAVLDVILNELSSKHQMILKEAVEQFQAGFFFSAKKRETRKSRFSD